MLHPSAERLESYVEGTLDAGEAAVLESHVLSCARCQTDVEEWRALFATLSTLPAVEPAPGFADLVMARVRVTRPWPARVAALLGRLLPDTARGWSLAAAFLLAPALGLGGGLAWLLAQPWVTVQGLVVFLSDRALTGAGWLYAQVSGIIMASDAVQSLGAALRTFVGTAGLAGIGTAAALIGTLFVVSSWILYRNLFGTHSRDAHHASLFV